MTIIRMGLTLPRKKERNLKLSAAYKLIKFIPLNPKAKLKLFLDLSWIFHRLAHEQTFKTTITIPSTGEEDIIGSFIEKDSSVLDIGCGKGYVAKRILPKTTHIVGVDYDPDAIQVAQKEFANTGAQFLCEDVFDYLKRTGGVQFDYIVLSHVLEHIDKPRDFLFSLKDSARFFYVEVPDFEANHLNLYRKEVQTDLVYTDADHISEFDRRELEALFASCQLQVVKSEFRYGVMKYWCQRIR